MASCGPCQNFGQSTKMPAAKRARAFAITKSGLTSFLFARHVITVKYARARVSGPRSRGEFLRGDEKRKGRPSPRTSSLSLVLSVPWNFVKTICRATSFGIRVSCSPLGTFLVLLEQKREPRITSSTQRELALAALFTRDAMLFSARRGRRAARHINQTYLASYKYNIAGR